MKKKNFMMLTIAAFILLFLSTNTKTNALTQKAIATDEFILQGEWMGAYGLESDDFFEGDFNGDGKTDIALGRPLVSQQNQYSWQVMLTNAAGDGFLDDGLWMDAYGLPGDTFLVGDYNGDNLSDILIGRPQASQENQYRWWAMLSSGDTFTRGGEWISAYGFPEDTFLSGDYDNSGEDDLVRGRSLDFQQDQYRWWMMLADSTGDGFVENGMWMDAYGLPGDTFLVGDYNGDNLSDILIGRPLASQQNQYKWWGMVSSGLTFTVGGEWLQMFGYPGNEVHQGDYNRDGASELILGKPLSEQQNQYRWWGTLSDGYELDEEGQWVEAYGVQGDVIKKGDFNGDGKTDITMGRPEVSQNNQLKWWVMTSNVQTIKEDNYEENDTRETAYDLSAYENKWLSSINGEGIQRDEDWYEIYVTSGYEVVSIEAEFEHIKGDINIGLFANDGTLLVTSTSQTDDESIDLQVPNGDESYYIKVYNADNGNPYDLWWDTNAGPINERPQINIVEPDGTNDVANLNYVIKWTDSDTDNDASISLYYDTDNSGKDGVLIVSGISEDDTTDSYTWDTSALAPGDYYVYAIIDDGVNSQVADYSSGPITILPPCTQYICNPSFESGFNYWDTAGTPDNQISNDAVDGTSSLYSKHTRITTESKIWSGVKQKINSVEPAQTYGFSMWIKSTDAARGHVKIIWYKSGGGVSRVDYPIINIDGTIGWTMMSKLITTPADAVMGEVFILHGINALTQNVTGSSLWIDDINFDIATLSCGTLCNESFEHGTLYWTISGQVGSHVIVSNDTHEGNKVLESEQLYGTTSQVKWAGVTQYTQVKAGTAYRLKLWLKSLSASNGHVRIRWRNVNGSILGVEYPIAGINGTNTSWFSREATIVAPANATKAEVSIWHGVTGNTTNVPGSTLWIDDISFICQNLCNAGFEDGNIHWESNGTNEGKIITADVHEGAQAMKTTQDLTPADPVQWAGISQRTLVTGGSNYTFTMWIKKENTVQGHVKVKWRDANDQVISQEYPKTGMNGTDATWTQQAMSLTAPASAETIEIFMWHGVNSTNQNSTGSTLFLDNINFTQVP